MIGSSNFSRNFFQTGSRGSGVSRFAPNFARLSATSACGQPGFAGIREQLGDVAERTHIDQRPGAVGRGTATGSCETTAEVSPAAKRGVRVPAVL